MAMFKAIKVLTNAIDLHENHLVRKRQKRLKEFRASITNQGPYTRYFDEAIHLEAVRIEFGVRAGKLKALALLKICELGYWDHIQIRHIAKFLILNTDHPSPKIIITKADKAGAWLGLSAGIITIIAGGVIWIGITMKGHSIYAYLSGLGLFCAFTIAAMIFSSGYWQYKNALTFQRYLSVHPEIFMNTDPAETLTRSIINPDDETTLAHCADARNKINQPA